MGKLILLYFGTIILAYLSQRYYPVKAHELSEKRHFMRDKADVFCVAIIVWMTCFSFLRTQYNDTGTYRGLFENAQSISEGLENGTFVDWTGNPWSMFYRSLVREFTDNFHIYFFFPALMCSVSITKFIKRYSCNPVFSLVIFYSIGTYILYVTALKQSMAMFFLILALPYAIEKKYFKFYILVIIAVMFHAHAFMFAIIPLLLEKPWGRMTWILLVATFFAMLTYDTTLGAFMEYAQSIGALVAENELFDGHQINVVRIYVYWVPVLISLIFQKCLFNNSTRAENLFVNMSIVSAFILTIGLVQGANLYARMAAYFEIATAVSLPWMISKIFVKKSARNINIIASILYFGYFLFEFVISKNFDENYQAIGLLEFIKTLF